MPKPATHILLEYPSQKSTLLYRASDGCHLAARIQTKVIAGEDPNPEKLSTRNYLDETFALMALRRIADADCAAQDARDDPAQGYAASFETRDAESRIVQPNGSVLNSLRN